MPRAERQRQQRLRVGTSGWVYDDWRGAFYPPDLPQSRWYNHYAKAFDTVEINYSCIFDMPGLPCPT